jgi:hypothetical protein
LARLAGLGQQLGCVSQPYMMLDYPRDNFCRFWANELA